MLIRSPGVEASGGEQSFGERGVQLVDDGIRRCHHEHVASLDQPGMGGVGHGIDCCGVVEVAVDSSVRVVDVDRRMIAVSKFE